MDPGKNILDIGCGNGRDSIFFYKKGLSVTGLDYSEDAINRLNDKYRKIQGITFVCDDFMKTNLFTDSKFDYCYCRFFIHAITQKQENILLDRVYTGLKKEGKFFIEVRSIKDELYGRGKRVERNAFIYNDHYRRFIVKDEIKENLEEKGFEIECIEESLGLAVFENYDPCIIRIVAKKV